MSSDMVTEPAPEPSRSFFWTVIETAMVIAFIAMLVVMFVQVVSRYALAIGVPWTDETSRFLYIAQIFLGLSIAQRYGQHIRITVALDLMGQRLRRMTEALSDLLTALICIALIIGGIEMIRKSGNALASTLPIPMSVIYGIQCLGIALYTLLVLKDIHEKLFSNNDKGAQG